MNTSSELNKNVKMYILDCVSDQAETNEMMKIVAYIEQRFTSEYDFMIKRVGKLKAMTDWLRGLNLDIEYRNYEILQLAILWGLIPSNYSEKQADKILDNYWHLMANKVLQLINNYRMPK